MTRIKLNLGMLVRAKTPDFATLQDMPDLLAVGERMHALTRFREHPYERARLEKAFTDLITQGQGKYAFLVAANSHEQVVGGLLGVMEQHIFSPGWCASVMHYDVVPEARGGGYAVRLLKAFEQWAKNRQAIEINPGINSGGGILSGWGGLPAAWGIARLGRTMFYRCKGGAWPDLNQGASDDFHFVERLGILAIDYVNNRYEIDSGLRNNGETNGQIFYASIQTVQLEAEQEGIRYTPVGAGIKIDTTNGAPQIVITQVQSEAGEQQYYENSSYKPPFHVTQGPKILKRCASSAEKQSIIPILGIKNSNALDGMPDSHLMSRSFSRMAGFDYVVAANDLAWEVAA